MALEVCAKLLFGTDIRQGNSRLNTTETGGQPLHPAIAGCLESCERCDEVLNALPPDTLVNAAEDESSIGAHLRHCIDHFVCFLDGWESQIIDYDARDRDAEIESNAKEAQRALDSIRAGLRGVPTESLSQTVNIRQSADKEGRASSAASTVERELAFLSGHAIHHLAVIELIARRDGIKFTKDFSLAFSTASYRMTSAEHAG